MTLQVQTYGMTLTVPIAEEGQRLDRWLTHKLPNLTRTQIQKLLESGSIMLNGKLEKGGTKLKAGDQILVLEPPRIQVGLTPSHLELNVIYEDDEILVVNKPAGLVVHPGAGETGVTLVEGILYHLGFRSTLDVMPGGVRPGIVHRLDKDTTGVMVCAKTEAALAHLSGQFANKSNDREYVSLLNGAMGTARIIQETYLERDPTSRLRFRSVTLSEFQKKFSDPSAAPKSLRYAKSEFYREATFGSRITLARVRLYTGRTHQIRVHSKDLGMHVLGDPVYGRPVQLPKHFAASVREKVAGLSRQMLHARLLGFDHPSTGQRMIFEADLPHDFNILLESLSPYRQIP